MLRTLFLLTALAACGDDDHHDKTPTDAPATPVDAPDTTPVDLKLQFLPKVGTETFACGHTYEHQGAEDTTVTPRDFRFYLMDLKLLKPDGSKVDVELEQDQTWQYKNVALLDFEDFTGSCLDGTPETHTLIHATAPAGKYVGVASTSASPKR